jgi:CheY-like chemotaxis protein
MTTTTALNPVSSRPEPDFAHCGPGHAAPSDEKSGLIAESVFTPRTGANAQNRRILVVDDNPAIHADFRKVLCRLRADNPSLSQAEAMLFGDNPEQKETTPGFEVESAHQGQEALEKVRQALAARTPYAMAFVDVRMPPGWDGVETICRVWEICPELQVVLCTAYSDYTWEEMNAKLGASGNLVILKKPFDRVEVLQLAHSLTRRWEQDREAELRMAQLNAMVADRVG